MSATQSPVGVSPGTRVFSLPPWRRGEAGTELSRTKANEHQGATTSDKRAADEKTGDVYDEYDRYESPQGTPERERDHDGGCRSIDSSCKRGKDESGRSVGSSYKRGSDESGRSIDSSYKSRMGESEGRGRGNAGAEEEAVVVVAAATKNNAEMCDASDYSTPAAASAEEETPTKTNPLSEKIELPSNGTSSPRPGRDTRTTTVDGGVMEDACLTDGSSDDDGDGSSHSQQTQDSDGASPSSDRLLQNEDQPLREEAAATSTNVTGAASTINVTGLFGSRRHSSWTAGTREGWIDGGGDLGSRLSENGRTTSRVGEGQRGDGKSPPEDPENEVAGVDVLEHLRRGVSRCDKVSVQMLPTRVTRDMTRVVLQFFKDMSWVPRNHIGSAYIRRACNGISKIQYTVRRSFAIQ